MVQIITCTIGNKEKHKSKLKHIEALVSGKQHAKNDKVVHANHGDKAEFPKDI